MQSQAMVDFAVPNQEGKCSLVGYLSLLRTVRANEGFSDNEKEVLRTEIERTDEFLAAPENAAMDTANTRHLSSIQAVCDSLVARYSIAMAIRVRFSINYTCMRRSLCLTIAGQTFAPQRFTQNPA
jgi:hypothetical protein